MTSEGNGSMKNAYPFLSKYSPTVTIDGIAQTVSRDYIALDHSCYKYCDLIGQSRWYKSHIPLVNSHILLVYSHIPLVIFN